MLGPVKRIGSSKSVSLGMKLDYCLPATGQTVSSAHGCLICIIFSTGCLELTNSGTQTLPLRLITNFASEHKQSISAT